MAPDVIVERVKGLEPPEGRLNLHKYGDWSVVDDSYNASPIAMRAAFQVLMSLPVNSRKVAVLGTMHELGDDEAEYHREVGECFYREGGDLLLGVGKGGRWMAGPP